MFAGKEQIWISSDRRTKIAYDKGNNDAALSVEGVVVGKWPGGVTEEHTAAGAVTPGVQFIEINSVPAIALTIADALNHRNGPFMLKHTSTSDAQSHTVVLTSGTWDGTNTVALVNAANEALIVWFDSGGDGTIIENVGSVSLG